MADPLQDTTTYNYSPTQGNPYLHTTDSAYFVTDPVQIVTANSYDPNFRKISTILGYGTSSAATTSFQYDYVGNLQKVTDPRGNITYTQYDARNRKSQPPKLMAPLVPRPRRSITMTGSMSLRLIGPMAQPRQRATMQ